MKCYLRGNHNTVTDLVLIRGVCEDFGSTIVFSLSEFQKHAAIGSEYEWNRYNFTHLKVLIDKNDRIQTLVDEKGRMPPEEIRDHVSRNLDGYINNIYRSLKCFRDENIVGARLEASRSIHFLLEVIFSIEGRIAPYYKFLEWELEKHPLQKFGMEPKEIVGCLLKILEDADVKTQQKLLEATERVCRIGGYGHILDDWGPDLEWVKTYEIQKRS